MEARLAVSIPPRGGDEPRGGSEEKADDTVTWHLDAQKPHLPPTLGVS